MRQNRKSRRGVNDVAEGQNVAHLFRSSTPGQVVLVVGPCPKKRPLNDSKAGAPLLGECGGWISSQAGRVRIGSDECSGNPRFSGEVLAEALGSGSRVVVQQSFWENVGDRRSGDESNAR